MNTRHQGDRASLGADARRKPSHRISKSTVAALAILTTGLALTATPALAGESVISTGQFATAGSGNGQLSDPTAAAVNDTTGDVYVVDHGNKRVEFFNAAGGYAGQFNGSVGPPTGAFVSPEYIAVDNSTTSLVGKEDVYVADTSDNVIDQFTASGTYVMGGQLTGTCENVGETPPECAGAGAGFVAFGELKGLAVDPEGNVWVYSGGEFGFNVDEFSDAGVFIKGFSTGSCAVPGFAVEPSGDFFVDNCSGNVTKWDPVTGEELAHFGGSGALAVDATTNDVFQDETSKIGEYAEPYEHPIATGPREGLAGSEGIAVTNGTSPTVYATQGEEDNVQSFDVALLPTVTTGSVPKTEIYPRVATLNGTVNPEGLPLSECAFEYVEEAQYKPGTPEPYAAGHTVPCAEGLGEEPGEIGKGVEPVEVKAEAPGLTTGTTYHFRLAAKNSNGTEVGADTTFQATPPTGIENESVSEVTESSAKLEARIDPSRAPTSYHFEYDTTAYTTNAPHGTSVPVPDVPIGSGEAAVEVAPEHVYGLTAGTVYDYRVVATSDIEATPHHTETTVFDGPDHIFTTHGSGEFALPDGRQWQLVSPPDKQGSLIEPIAGPSDLEGVVQAAADGHAITYVANAPTETHPAGSDNFVQVLSTVAAGGWGTHDLTIPHESWTEATVGKGQEYRFFSEDLSRAAVQPFGKFTPCENTEHEPQPCISPEASEQTAFLEDTATSVFTPFVTGCPSAVEEAEGHHCRPEVREHANVPPGTIFGQGECFANSRCGPEFEYATPDLAHAMISGQEWTAAAPPAEQLQPLFLLPAAEGDAHVEAAVPGLPQLVHQLSDDGSIFFDYEGHIYLQNPSRHETLRLHPVTGGASEGEASFLYASSDGSTLLFRDSEQLTSTPGGGVYECRLAEEPGRLGCSTLTLTGLPFAGTLIGGSEDASVLYFQDGPLIVDRREGGVWTQTSIATLAPIDVEHVTEAELPHRTARVSPNGEWFAFMSQSSLTGYDNRDAVSGQPDEEVYLYHAATGKLTCASCNPTGARPHGTEFGVEGNGAVPNIPLAGGNRVWPGTSWLAANIPGWTPYQLGFAYYQSRYLSDSGRLFFNAGDALVPKDINGTEDVYEYEPAGTPAGEHACSPARAGGGEVFKPERETQPGVIEPAACVALISSGASAQESAFLDASETGGDVFFLTSAKLSALDLDTSLDVYDAHECTSASPCLPEPASESPPCRTEASCKPAPESQPSIYGPPASATFSGAGHPVSTPPSPPKQVTKKTVKCKRGFVKKKFKKQERCVKVKSNTKTKRSAHINRRTGR